MKLIARPIYNVIVVGFVFAFAQLHARVLAPEKYQLTDYGIVVWWTTFAVAQICLGYALGLPELAPSRISAVVRGAVATVGAFVVISTFQALLATPLLPRSSSALVGVVLPIWAVIAWNLTRDVTERAATRDRVFLVVERDEDIVNLERDLETGSELPATVVGALTLDQVRAVGTVAVIRDEVRRIGASILVLDTGSQADASIVEQAAALHRDGIRIRTLALFYEEWIGKLPHPELARVSLLFDIGELHRVRYVRAKRIVDIGFALVGLLALLPLTLVVSVMNPLANRGPLIYRQLRVGRHGEEFVIYKLRTMVPSKDGGSDGASTWTTAGDTRITPLGQMLRRSHLDELPQVLNILKGDLSLVGPRPEQPHYVADLADKIDFYDVRHIVRPGLTGWAQVKQGYAADHVDAFEKLQYDFYYLRRQGFAFDTRILWRTVRGVVGGDGR